MPTHYTQRARRSYSRNVPVGWPINTQMYDLARHSDKIPTFQHCHTYSAAPTTPRSHIYNIRYINMCCLWFYGCGALLIWYSAVLYAPANPHTFPGPTCELNCITMTYRILCGKARVRQLFGIAHTQYSSCTQIKWCVYARA